MVYDTLVRNHPAISWSHVMRGRSERRTDSLSPASAVSPAALYSILPSRVRESSGKRCDLVSLPLSDQNKASSDRSEPRFCESR